MSYDLIIIGSGPAGYVAAIRAGQTGLKTLVIDKKYVGGMCLNWGCIPTKCLLESAKLFKRISKDAADFGVKGYNPDELAFDWQQAVNRSKSIVSKLSKGIEYLWKKNAVEFLMAEAKILSPTTVEANKQIYETKSILVATGSKPVPLERLMSVIELEDFLQLPALPTKPLIYGAGAIVWEFTQFFTLLGIQPTIISTSDPLVPKLDAYLNAYILKRTKKDKIKMIPAEEIKIESGSLHHSGSKLDYDAVLNCNLRQAVLPSSDIDLSLSDGFIQVDEHYRSSIPAIFAAGDVTGLSYLAHAASDQGLQVVASLNGQHGIHHSQYPINIYSDPEIAQIGHTENDLINSGISYEVKELPLIANGKALAEGSSEGFIRLLYETKYHQVLGVQIVAANATDLISEAGVLMAMEGTVYDLANTIHAHPTVSEIFMDLARQVPE